MAQLLLIKADTFKAGINEIGDVLGIFDDCHQFDPNEHRMFEVIRIDGTKEEVYSQAVAKTPVIKKMYKADSTDWSEVPPELIEVWADDGKLKILADRPKYTLRWTGSDFVHNLNRVAENNVDEIADGKIVKIK